jgi:hypothetical protein
MTLATEELGSEGFHAADVRAVRAFAFCAPGCERVQRPTCSGRSRARGDGTPGCGISAQTVLCPQKSPVLQGSRFPEARENAEGQKGTVRRDSFHEWNTEASLGRGARGDQHAFLVETYRNAKQHGTNRSGLGGREGLSEGRRCSLLQVVCRPYTDAAACGLAGADWTRRRLASGRGAAEPSAPMRVERR